MIESKILPNDKFVFFLDWDEETGHGWRNWPLDKVRVHLDSPRKDPEKKPYSPFYLQLLDEGEEDSSHKVRNPELTYFWLTTERSFAKHGMRGFAADELRAPDVRKVVPAFHYSDNMEGHFEADTCPTYLIMRLKGMGFRYGGDVGGIYDGLRRTAISFT